MKWLIITTCLVPLLFAQVAAADEGDDSLPMGSKVVGKVHFSKKNRKITGHAKRDIDALIPRLKKMGKRKMVRIEGRAYPDKDRERYIANSLNLAKEVKLYLFMKLGQQLDLYIGAMDDKIPSGDRNVVRIVLYPYEISEESN